ncbi:aldo/keto reductase [Verrucomicrobium sp. BvORR106]|uniref:aldo/keto reductase n=1 Tax=Verrucomicrobium sp. BvORR106 TaxID=1403819 RepID=UPI00056EB28A|nr:aldo/keto reductase [Verrucomicrobium sp. BvORR106]
MSLPRLKLSPNGPEFSRLVYGTWRVLDDGSSLQELNRRLNRCADLGMTTIDTAEIYGLYEVEEALGKALALSPGLRDRLEIVTKAGIYVPNKFHPERRTAFYNASASRLIKSLEKSLRFLGTDRVDLFLVHRPDWLTSADDTASGLNQLVRDGKIASAGVSNYSVTQYDLLNSRLDQPLVTNQVEFHLLHMDPVYDGVFDQCQKLQVRPMAWSPLAGGRLFDATNEAARRLAAEAARLANKYDGATLEQLAYAWILAHPAQALPVIGTNKVERIESAAQSSRIQLEREDWYSLWEAAKGHKIP